MSEPQKVAIVVSDEFASSSNLSAIALTRHLWALRTPETEAAADWIRWVQQEGGVDPLRSGVTLFAGDGEPESDLLSILDEVELHHGALSGGSPLGEITVYGAELTDDVREAFGSLGFLSFEDMPRGRGFVAYRKP